jgi:hypothetical protein
MGTHAPRYADIVLSDSTRFVGLLSEGSVTNGLPNSLCRGADSWLTYNSTIENITGISTPDLEQDCVKISEDNSNNYHFSYLKQTNWQTLSATQCVCISCFLKKGTARYAVLGAYQSDSTKVAGIIVDLETNTITDSGNGDASMVYVLGSYVDKPYNNLWCRVFVRLYLNATTSTYMYVMLGTSSSSTFNSRSFQGSTSNYIYAWGASFERFGSTNYPTFPRMLVRSSGGVGTKAADDLTYLAAGNYSPNSGAISLSIAYLYPNAVFNYPTLVSINDDTSNNKIELRLGADGSKVEPVIVKGGNATTFNQFTKNLCDGKKHDILFTYGPTDVCVYIDGILDARVTGTYSYPTNLTKIKIGKHASDSTSWYSEGLLINNVKIYGDKYSLKK